MNINIYINKYINIYIHTYITLHYIQREMRVRVHIYKSKCENLERRGATSVTRNNKHEEEEENRRKNRNR